MILPSLHKMTPFAIFKFATNVAGLGHADHSLQQLLSQRLKKKMNVSLFENEMNETLSNITQLRRAILYSKFKYETVARPGVELALWILVSMGVLCNIGVIVFRYWKHKTSCREISPMSILLINLAFSDLLIAVGKIFFLVTIRIAKNCCQVTTKTMRKMCFVAFELSTIGGGTTTAILLVFAAYGYVQIIGCCNTIRRISMKTTVVVLLLVWAIGIAQGIPVISGMHVTIKTKRREILDWHICWAYDTFPRSAFNRYRDFVSVSGYILATTTVGILYTATVAFTYCRANSAYAHLHTQIGFRLISVVLTNVLLVLVQTSWDMILLTNDIESMLNKKYFQYLAVLVTFSVSFLSLTNSVILTVSTADCWKAIKRTIFRLKPKRNCEQKTTGSSSTLARVDETTSLFPESSLSFV